ncbi:MAG: ribosome recycling factor [Gemmatimonadetes bacterium]|nr:ribosome recycling factor [Gemmatimonadota bacterium]
MIDEFLTDCSRRMDQAVEHLRRELTSIRTGRASPLLIEDLSIDYYGQPTPLKQIAGISAPEARLLLIQPWDKGALPDIEKAIVASDLGITPSNDGNVIHLPIPQLSEDRRRDIVRLVKQRTEDARVAVRNIRRDVHDDLRELVTEKEASEDEFRRSEGALQQATDKHVEAIDTLGQQKEAEVMQV